VGRPARAAGPAHPLFDHLQTLSISYFDRHTAGTLISRLTNNVETLDQLVTDGVNALVSSVVTIVSSVVSSSCSTLSSRL
jgi:ABC-type multidrug transport system fused ATPase/permease subunit